MNNSHDNRPLARQEGLVIQEMPDEILVYDLETNKAHCLNETAAFVWKKCDGVNSIADITKAFGNQSGKLVPENIVWLAIDQLNESKLLAEELKADFSGQSRREVIKKIGLAAVIALPIVSSLVAPKAAYAVQCSQNPVPSCTGCPDGRSCTCPPGCTTPAGTCLGGGCANCTNPGSNGTPPTACT